MKKKILLLMTILSIFFMGWLSPRFFNDVRSKGIFTQDFVKGRVIKVEKENLMYDPVVKGKFRGSQVLEVKLLEGEYKGKEFRVYNSLDALHNTYATQGLEAIFTVRKDNGKTVVWLYNLDRENKLYFLGAIFIGLVVLLVRLKGVKSILALVFTGAMIVYVLLPLLFTGANPIVVSTIIASIVIIVSFLLIGDFNRKTYSAILGTIFGVLIAGILSFAFGKLMDLNGLNMPSGEQLLYIAKDYKLKVGGLLFVSILISSLGAVMDVAMSISSSVNEIYQHNSNISNKDLFKSAMAIGKDIVGTMINTLILAFAGGSLPLMMMIWGYGMVYRQFINIPTIAIEIVNALAGSIGIITAVPLTAIISIILIKNTNQKREGLS